MGLLIAKYAFIRELTILALLRLPGHSPYHWKAHKSTNERYSQPGARLQGWKSQLLTFAGRKTPTKSVTAGIPNHMLSNFKLPIYTINQIEVLQRDFLWSQGESQKIHAVNWWSVCQPWQEGGLAIRSLALKNSAFQAKLLWRLLTCTATSFPK